MFSCLLQSSRFSQFSFCYDDDDDDDDDDVHFL